MGKGVLQYYCGNCNNILKEVESELNLVNSIEPCPNCGTLLSETLQKRSIIQKQRVRPTVFQKASGIPRLTLDIPKIDSILDFLTLNQKVCITGPYSQKLIERICVRVQLPHRYGGLNSNVVLIDGANTSDLYQCISFAQHYQLNVKKVLEKIYTSRTFTAYQLADLILYDLQQVIETTKTKVLIITDLLHFFTDDPYFDSQEVRLLLEQIADAISKVKDCLVIVSLSRPTEYDKIFLQLFDKTLQISKDYHRLSIKVSEENKTQSVLLKKSELETIPSH